MKRFLRFRDLQKAGVVRSRPCLALWIKTCGFPRGVKLGANTRVWSEDEIEDWLASRPTSPKSPPTVKRRRGRPRKSLTQLPSTDAPEITP